MLQAQLSPFDAVQPFAMPRIVIRTEAEFTRMMAPTIPSTLVGRFVPVCTGPSGRWTDADSANQARDELHKARQACKTEMTKLQSVLDEQKMKTTKLESDLEK
jgi:hypothetical protein